MLLDPAPDTALRLPRRVLQLPPGLAEGLPGAPDPFGLALPVIDAVLGPCAAHPVGTGP